jgi:hypothetical protein
MLREPSEPFGRDHVELPCFFIPDGYQGPRPGHAFGYDTVEFRCIFIPDGYDGPRPGYPWIEFGRMTLDPAREVAEAAGRAARSGELTSTGAFTTHHGQATAASEPGTTTPLPPRAAPGQFDGSSRIAGTADDGVETSRMLHADHGYPDIGTAMQVWDAVCNGLVLQHLAATQTYLAQAGHTNLQEQPPDAPEADR